MAEVRKRKVVKNKKGGKMDITFLSVVLILMTVGLVMLYSASYAYSLEYYGNSYKFIIQQLEYGAVGIVAMLITSKINYHFYRNFVWIIFFGVFILLIILLLVPPMIKGMDVKRWIAIGSFSFQPSEFAKFAIILLFSSLISANYKQMDKIGFVVFLLLILGITTVLIAKEPHYSAAFIVLILGVVLMIVGGLGWKFICVGGIIGAVGGAVLYTVFKSGAVEYVKDKLDFWLDPWKDPSGKGFQAIQSLLAIGSGGIWGKGIGQSRQKLLWVPEPHNDFIFSIICEEVGLIGAVIIIALFCFLVWRGFYIAMHAEDKYGSLLAIGLTFQVGLQAMLNILVVTNTLPNTGISLPFFSYGGTSLVLLLAEMGIVLNISRSTDMEKL